MTNLSANWPAPPNVFALTTTRSEGFSAAPYNSNNLGLHVGDNPAHVMANREALATSLDLPGSPEWLEQTHTNLCVVVEDDQNRTVDASVTRSPRRVLCVMTADCQPILLCNRQGTEVAAIHAGWKGLANGIIENTLAKMKSSPKDVIAWLGPVICQDCFEVGDDVRDIYLINYPFSNSSFKQHGKKWLANLPGITKEILIQLSVSSVHASNRCTFEGKNEFYSYRREQQTGRMASLIWFN